MQFNILPFAHGLLHSERADSGIESVIYQNCRRSNRNFLYDICYRFGTNLQSRYFIALGFGSHLNDMAYQKMFAVHVCFNKSFEILGSMLFSFYLQNMYRVLYMGFVYSR